MRELNYEEIDEVCGASWRASIIGGGITLASGLGGVVTATTAVASGALTVAALPAILGATAVAGGGYLIYSGINQYRVDQLQMLQSCGL